MFTILEEENEPLSKHHFLLQLHSSISNQQQQTPAATGTDDTSNITPISQAGYMFWGERRLKETLIHQLADGWPG
jgi:hypothetical protein